MKTISALAGKLAGKDIWVVGSGTSLTRFDYSLIRDFPTIALNGAGRRFIPWVHLFADEILWKEYADIKHPPGVAVVCQDGAIAQLNSAPRCSYRRQLFCFKRHNIPKVRRHDELLYVCKTVATAGVELAWKLGASRIFLLGIDAYRTAKRYYCDESRPRREEKGRDMGHDRLQEDRHRDWARELSSVAAFLGNDYASTWPGAGIYVANPQSLVECWPHVSLDEIFSTIEPPMSVSESGPPCWW